jgi:hypothetical protein
MAGWMIMPGGRVINSQRVENQVVQFRSLILNFDDGTTLPIDYDSQADAFYAKGLLETVVLSSTASGPTLISVSPSSVVSGVGLTVFTITGTNFIASAVISVSGSGAFPTTFISSTTLQITINVIGAPGSYDVDYADGAGGTAHLANGITLT